MLPFQMLMLMLLLLLPFASNRYPRPFVVVIGTHHLAGPCDAQQPEIVATLSGMSPDPWGLSQAVKQRIIASCKDHSM